MGAICRVARHRCGSSRVTASFIVGLVPFTNLDILVPHRHCLGLDPLIQFVFCDAIETGVWQDIMSVEVKISLKGSSSKNGHFFSQMVGHQ